MLKEYQNFSFYFQKTAVSSVFVPSLGVKVDGTCNSTNGTHQYITLSWGKNSVQLNFDTGDKDSWTFTSLNASLYIDDDDFANATVAGR